MNWTADRRRLAIGALARQSRPRMSETRRDIHMHPELSHHEERTAGIVAERLQATGRTVIRRPRRGARPGGDPPTDRDTPLTSLQITVGSLRFVARLEEALAPATCAAFCRLLPFRNRLIQARWSGEAAWVPLGDLDLGLGYENHTSHPSRGEILLYPGGISETEILFPYGHVSFASKVGPLAGNHFLTVTEGAEQLSELGRRVLWEGAQEILFELGDTGS